jgi:hypothetical protein
MAARWIANDLIKVDSTPRVADKSVVTYGLGFWTSGFFAGAVKFMTVSKLCRCLRTNYPVEKVAKQGEGIQSIEGTAAEQLV